jgi:hypothetical protein
MEQRVNRSCFLKRPLYIFLSRKIANHTAEIGDAIDLEFTDREMHWKYRAVFPYAFKFPAYADYIFLACF